MASISSFTNPVVSQLTGQAVEKGIVPGSGGSAIGGSVLPNDPYFQSPEYRALQERMGSGPQIGTADIYDSPYFGRFGSGSIGRQQDEAYKQYLARINASPNIISNLTMTSGPVGAQVYTPIDSQGNPIGTPFGPGYIPPQTPIPGGSTADLISQLPALRGTTSGESRIDPTLRPYLELGLRRGEQLFFGAQQPSLYPGQMFVSPSQQTQQALATQEALATQPSPFLEQAGRSYMGALGGLGQIASGSFLAGSPYRQQAIESATRPLMQQFEQSTLPAIQSAFSRAGRYGSGAQERAIGQATEATSRAIGDVAAQIAAADYARERQLMQQALGQELAAAQVAPQFFAQQFLPSQQLAQIGAAREAIAAQPLQEAMTRYQFQQQLPYQQLQSFLSGVYGTPLASSQYQQIPQAQRNVGAGALGGAALGAGIGQMIGGSYGGFSAPMIGAGLGGLLGGFL